MAATSPASSFATDSTASLDTLRHLHSQCVITLEAICSDPEYHSRQWSELLISLREWGACLAGTPSEPHSFESRLKNNAPLRDALRTHLQMLLSILKQSKSPLSRFYVLSEFTQLHYLLTYRLHIGRAFYPSNLPVDRQQLTDLQQTDKKKQTRPSPSRLPASMFCRQPSTTTTAPFNIQPSLSAFPTWVPFKVRHPISRRTNTYDPQRGVYSQTLWTLS